MAEILHSFHEGMDKDTSKLYFSNTKYYTLRNFQLLTDLGTSTLSLETPKGNKLDFTIPNTQGVYKLFLLPGTIGINGESFLIDEDTTLDILFDTLNNSNLQLGVDLKIFRKEDHILLFGLNNLTVNSTNPDSFETLVEPLSNLRIIHIDSILEKIVVFTTSNTDSESENKDGQIWMFEYDDNDLIPNINGTDLNPSFHLIYNNQLNLSTEHYIRKSLLRYENNKFLRLYFTDFYNPVRSMNLFDVDLFATNPSDLDFLSNVSFTKPEIFDISSGGNIPIGASVQFAYQLVNGDKETIVSPTSDLLPIILGDDENSGFLDLNGAQQGTSTGKSVSYKVNDIDLDFDFIKHIAIIYEFNNLPIIKIFKEESIPQSRSVNVTFTNNEESIPMSEQEFNLLNTQFTHCKDLTQKDNRLIAANTITKSFEITDEEFDSRAYRFKSDGVGIIKDKLNQILTIPSDFNVPFTHDAINPYNNEDDVDYDDYIYQSDGTTMGGEGKYVKYKFIKQNLDTIRLQDSLPFANGNLKRTLNVNFGNNIQYSINNQFIHPKSPFVHSLFAGYCNDEIYRFGIVFRNNKGQVSFTKWIGDIKFPRRRLVEGDTTPNLSQLGIEFEITIPDSLKDKISSYEIVRVERDHTNRTNLGSGYLETFEQTSGGTDLYNSGSLLFDPAIYSNSSPGRFVGLIAPTLLFQEYTNTYFREGDYIEIDKYNPRNTSYDFITPGLVSVNRLYSYINTPNRINIPILSLNKVDRGGTIGTLNEVTTNNDGWGAFFNYFQGVEGERKRGKTFFAELDMQSVGFTGIGEMLNSINPNEDIALSFQYRRKLQKQYGGNTYEERSTNRYISTGCFVNVNESKTLKVFGGDNWYNYFDYESIQNIDNSSPSSVGWLFYTSSPFNTDMRSGNHFNDNRSTTLPPDEQHVTEDYLLNTVYIQENNSKKIYVNKPLKDFYDDRQPYAIWVSELKVNGELRDSWLRFKTNNFLEVDGIYGQVNAIYNHNGKVYFFQDKALGIVPINERVVTTNEDGIELSLGTGDVISNYGYISTNSGCFHTSAVVPTEDYLYFFDIRTRKFYRISSDSKQPLSDLKGLNSYFFNLFPNTLINKIDSKTSLLPIGIHGVYDNRYNRVIYTFNNGSSTTISYNEALNCFEAEYDIDASVYHNTGRIILSVAGLNSTASRGRCYMHNVGNYGEFYDKVYDSKIALIANAKNLATKEWNNIEWYSECYNNNNDIPNETYDTIRIYNDHQDTGEVSLHPSNLRRRFRYWRHAFKRDINSPNEKARIRNPWVFIELTKKNENNHRFISHPINVYYLL